MNHFMISNLLINSINKMDSGYIIIDTLYFIMLSMIITYFMTPNFKNKLYNMVSLYYNTSNKIIFPSHTHCTSKKYRSIMYYISKSNDTSIKILSEIIERKNKKNDENDEKKETIYRVEQNNKFMIDEKLGIQGIVYTQDEEHANNGPFKSEYIKYNYLEIFSKKCSLIDLELWVDKVVDEYNTYLKLKTFDKQQLIEVSWDTTQKDIDIYNIPWESNVTFENRFFKNKNEILSKINFFLDNPDWYKKRGIPYTLGFLIWGEPGCGKTGFIKALMNLTKRHGISIKLNNSFDMNSLREIIYNDEISHDIIIPQQKRIIIFEDIDCMGDIVEDRNTKKKIDPTSEKPIINYNDNLSFFLNILDGLQECTGRIIIMTTNKPDFLDKALIRPGRIDYNINFTKASINEIKEIIEFYWNESINNNIIDSLNNKLTHAEIVNLCRTSDNFNETVLKLSNFII